MKKVEASAKTREEAIQNALKDLGVEMYEVDKIEVLDEGSKGLFGFGARPVKVRLVVENMPDDPRRDESAAEPPRQNSRGRDGGRNQNREARGERAEAPAEQEGRGREGQPRGERGRREGQARSERPPREDRPRGERGGRSDRPRGERANRDKAAEATNGNAAARSEGAGGRGRGDRENNRNRNENQRARGERSERGRGRNERDGAPAAERPPRDEELLAATTDQEMQADGITADIIEPITDAQGTEAAGLLEEIISKMGIEAKADFARCDDGSARLNVSSEDSAILIGRKGRNLGAMQYLINRMISRGDTNENTERLVVDVEGYVDRRRESLQEMARSMAERAKESQRNMRLKPLSPQERRIIHLALEGDEDIRTFSLGESLYRSVVISPKGAVQPERGRGGSRGGRGGRGGRRRGGRDRSQESRAEGGRNNEQDVDVGAFGD